MSERRKLAAVVFTDIVSYSSLMCRDEELAMAVLHRNREIQRPLTEKYGGEFLKEMGDGTLLCFSSALDAVKCAIEIQQAVENEPDFNLRIGIHEGDVLFEDNDVFGDGVNIASRIERLSEAGCICITEDVYHSIRNIPGFKISFLGERKVKHVKQPVRVYRIIVGVHSKPKRMRQLLPRKPLKYSSVAAMAVITILTVLQIAGIHVFPRRYAPAHPFRIAVMTFSSANEDTQGLAEDLRQLLSQAKYFQIISLHELMAAGRRLGVAIDKTASPSLQMDIAKACGAALLITGECIKSQNCLQIKMDITDVVTGVLRDSKSYDELVNRVNAIDTLGFQIKQKLGFAEEAVKEQGTSVAQIFTANSDARNEFIKGKKLAAGCRFSEAVTAFQQATVHDTSFALAYSWLARMYKNVRDDEQAQAAAANAAKYQSRLPENERYHIEFIEALSKSYYSDADEKIWKWIERTTNNADAYFLRGELNLRYLKEYDDAIGAYKRVLEIDPDYTIAINYIGYAYAHKGKNDEALRWLNKYKNRHPDKPNP